MKVDSAVGAFVVKTMIAFLQNVPCIVCDETAVAHLVTVGDDRSYMNVAGFCAVHSPVKITGEGKGTLIP